MAGALKRAAPNQSEDITLISALRDSNLPKFLSDDAVLFKGILSDLFPGLELPIVDYGALQECIGTILRIKPKSYLSFKFRSNFSALHG